MKDSTALPDWAHAERAEDLVPVLDRDGELADKFVKLCGKFRLTQGAVAGQRLEEVWLPWQRKAFKASFQCRESLWIMGKRSSKSVCVSAQLFTRRESQRTTRLDA